jgi:predicted pyridoxine 5'-phosphate oxidase superfamily flavin-nucleotide-binding protein
LASQFPHLQPHHHGFIAAQHMFFTASAAASGHVNVSPRSTDMFRVLGDNTVMYLDRTGSGNETAAHLRENGRLTIMFCAVAGPPLIMRLYGKATSFIGIRRNSRSALLPIMTVKPRLQPKTLLRFLS